MFFLPGGVQINTYDGDTYLMSFEPQHNKTYAMTHALSEDLILDQDGLFFKGWQEPEVCCCCFFMQTAKTLMSLSIVDMHKSTDSQDS